MYPEEQLQGLSRLIVSSVHSRQLPCKASSRRAYGVYYALTTALRYSLQIITQPCACIVRIAARRTAFDHLVRPYIQITCKEVVAQAWGVY